MADIHGFIPISCGDGIKQAATGRFARKALDPGERVRAENVVNQIFGLSAQSALCGFEIEVEQSGKLVAVRRA